MIKFLLIHSYSDFNKGDAAIIIATIQNLRRVYPNCRIDLQSTFSSDDPCFAEEHLEIKKYADDIHTCLFPQLFLKKSDSIRYDTLSKSLSLIKYTIKNLINYFSLKFVGSLLVGNKMEHKSIAAIKNSDVVLSKGGSFLCSDGSIRGDISFFRLLHPFIIAKIFKKKTVIFSQSLGPFNSKISRKIFRYGMRHIDTIFIREHETIRLLDSYGISIPKNKLNFCPDIAFTLDSSKGKKIVNPNRDILNIGLTIVDFNFKNDKAKEDYLAALKGVVLHVLKNYDAHFYIFPQVLNKHPEFGTEDMRLAKKLVTSLENTHHITLFEGNYECIDLAETYSHMDIFIATRLHSSIFATSKGVPAINIAYHGTKSEGTFKLLGCSDYVFKINEIDSDLLISKVLELVNKRESVRMQLEKSLQKIHDDIEKAVGSLA